MHALQACSDVTSCPQGFPSNSSSSTAKRRTSKERGSQRGPQRSTTQSVWPVTLVSRDVTHVSNDAKYGRVAWCNVAVCRVQCPDFTFNGSNDASKIIFQECKAYSNVATAVLNSPESCQEILVMSSALETD